MKFSYRTIRDFREMKVANMAAHPRNIVRLPAELRSMSAKNAERGRGPLHGLTDIRRKRRGVNP